MNCRESKVAIALHLGHDDADPADWEQARRHASTCDECRQHYKKLKKALSVLEQADGERTYDVHESLWPEIESRLTSQPGQKGDDSGRSWAPFASLAVACMLFLMVWANPPQEPDPGRSQIQSGKSAWGSFSKLFGESSRDARDAAVDEFELEETADTL